MHVASHRRLIQPLRAGYTYDGQAVQAGSHRIETVDTQSRVRRARVPIWAVRVWFLLRPDRMAELECCPTYREGDGMLSRDRRRRRQSLARDKRRKQRAFRSAAEALSIAVGRSVLDISFRDAFTGFGGTLLVGDVGGHHIRYRYSMGVDSSAWGSICSLRYSGGPLGIKLSIQRRSTSWWKSAVTTGDESFDALMFVKTTEPDRMQLMLDGRVRRQILDLAFDGKLMIKDKTIRFDERIEDPSTDEIVDTVQRLVSVAGVLERARSTSGHST
jgi:hypothetical protein